MASKFERDACLDCPACGMVTATSLCLSFCGKCDLQLTGCRGRYKHFASGCIYCYKSFCEEGLELHRLECPAVTQEHTYSGVSTAKPYRRRRLTDAEYAARLHERLQTESGRRKEKKRKTTQRARQPRQIQPQREGGRENDRKRRDSPQMVRREIPQPPLPPPLLIEPIEVLGIGELSISQPQFEHGVTNGIRNHFGCVKCENAMERILYGQHVRREVPLGPFSHGLSESQGFYHVDCGECRRSAVIGLLGRDTNRV